MKKIIFILLIASCVYGQNSYSRYMKNALGVVTTGDTTVYLCPTDSTYPAGKLWMAESYYDGLYSIARIPTASYNLYVSDTLFDTNIRIEPEFETSVSSKFSSNYKIKDVAGWNVVGDTLFGDGGVISTDTDSQRVIIDGVTNRIEFYDNVRLVGYILGGLDMVQIYMGGDAYTNNAFKIVNYTGTNMLSLEQYGGDFRLGTATYGKLSIAQSSAGSGRLSLPSGTTEADGMYFGSDVTLYRSSANTLKTDDSLTVAGNLTVNGSYGLVAADMPASIDATKLANGTVTNAELQYINTVSSNVQTQINTKRGYLSGVYTGAPGAGVGSNGDIAYDEDLGGKYVKINGSWISF